MVLSGTNHATSAVVCDPKFDGNDVISNKDDTDRLRVQNVASDSAEGPMPLLQRESSLIFHQQDNLGQCYSSSTVSAMARLMGLHDDQELLAAGQASVVVLPKTRLLHVLKAGSGTPLDEASAALALLCEAGQYDAVVQYGSPLLKAASAAVPFSPLGVGKQPVPHLEHLAADLALSIALAHISLAGGAGSGGSASSSSGSSNRGSSSGLMDLEEVHSHLEMALQGVAVALAEEVLRSTPPVATPPAPPPAAAAAAPAPAGSGSGTWTGPLAKNLASGAPAAAIGTSSTPSDNSSASAIAARRSKAISVLRSALWRGGAPSHWHNQSHPSALSSPQRKQGRPGEAQTASTALEANGGGGGIRVSELTPDERSEMMAPLRGLLTASEHVRAECGWFLEERLEAVIALYGPVASGQKPYGAVQLLDQELYDLAIAHLAQGVSTGWPQHVLQALSYFERIAQQQQQQGALEMAQPGATGAADVSFERRVCEALLGRRTTAAGPPDPPLPISPPSAASTASSAAAVAAATASLPYSLTGEDWGDLDESALLRRLEAQLVMAAAGSSSGGGGGSGLLAGLRGGSAEGAVSFEVGFVYAADCNNGPLMEARSFLKPRGDVVFATVDVFLGFRRDVSYGCVADVSDRCTELFQVNERGDGAGGSEYSDDDGAVSLATAAAAAAPARRVSAVGKAAAKAAVTSVDGRPPAAAAAAAAEAAAVPVHGDKLSAVGKTTTQQQKQEQQVAAADLHGDDGKARQETDRGRGRVDDVAHKYGWAESWLELSVMPCFPEMAGAGTVSLAKWFSDPRVVLFNKLTVAAFASIAFASTAVACAAAAGRLLTTSCAASGGSQRGGAADDCLAAGQCGGACVRRQPPEAVAAVAGGGERSGGRAAVAVQAPPRAATAAAEATASASAGDVLEWPRAAAAAAALPHQDSEQLPLFDGGPNTNNVVPFPAGTAAAAGGNVGGGVGGSAGSGSVGAAVAMPVSPTAVPAAAPPVAGGLVDVTVAAPPANVAADADVSVGGGALWVPDAEGHLHPRPRMVTRAVHCAAAAAASIKERVSTLPGAPRDWTIVGLDQAAIEEAMSRDAVRRVAAAAAQAICLGVLAAYVGNRIVASGALQAAAASGYSAAAAAAAAAPTVDASTAQVAAAARAVARWLCGGAAGSAAHEALGSWPLQLGAQDGGQKTEALPFSVEAVGVGSVGRLAEQYGRRAELDEPAAAALVRGWAAARAAAPALTDPRDRSELLSVLLGGRALKAARAEAERNARMGRRVHVQRIDVEVEQLHVRTARVVVPGFVNALGQGHGQGTGPEVAVTAVVVTTGTETSRASPLPLSYCSTERLNLTFRRTAAPEAPSAAAGIGVIGLVWPHSACHGGYGSGKERESDRQTDKQKRVRQVVIKVVPYFERQYGGRAARFQQGRLNQVVQRHRRMVALLGERATDTMHVVDDASGTIAIASLKAGGMGHLVCLADGSCTCKAGSVSGVCVHLEAVYRLHGRTVARQAADVMVFRSLTTKFFDAGKVALPYVY
ncbi:hypothetical protein VOLCADRAFT_97527 [Volvox carteri f. nagariensis]|uniref:SWIM-type domain-containing protein n=1 Tax=Volvox carteri f. nagariensis TaxID=3068 RepID=D8UCY9_VOLCA|nr:uncharacterized protein VOLCADRAFT_97527 [Volvox carteri f. nagariensis]EFJ42474.1 hypothetical protein VOLCADRAFT_97527 [Volvox carteri f. nagariensis]|eukprot:XP_002956537.1 hypothetical protein VOLCADRAFT_97527 [Volvox carteri f. nagariensis]